jgi:uncharacterized protein YndB with AHSA1/START domain
MPTTAITSAIRHRVGIAAPQQTVFDAVATLEGLASWWTRDVVGDPREGGQLQFTFGGPKRSVTMEVVEVMPTTRVVWRCVGGPDEWLDTTFRFDLANADGETVLRFVNEGWREPVEFMYHCTTKWGYFLLGLKHAIEDGRGNPYPDEVNISSWG